MAVYMLERIKVLRAGCADEETVVGEEAVDYEEAYAAVAVAPDAATARRVVQANTGKDVWLDTGKVRVRQVRQPSPSSTRCVLVASTGA